MKRIALVLGISVALAVSSSAMTITADFTHAAFDGVNGPPIPNTSFTIFDFMSSGVDLSIDLIVGTALVNDTATISPPLPPELPNGIGVFTFPGDSDSSELSDAERVRFTFSQAVVLDSFLVSKLFVPAAGKGDPSSESGLYSLDAAADQLFTATNLDFEEGRESFAIGGAPITTIEFGSPGGDNEYSIVSLTFTVPEPALLVQLLTGAVALLAARRLASPISH